MLRLKVTVNNIQSCPDFFREIGIEERRMDRLKGPDPTNPGRQVTSSTNVWNQAGIKLVTPGSAFRHASAVRHVTDCHWGLHNQWY